MIHALEALNYMLCLISLAAIAWTGTQIPNGKAATLRALDYSLPLLALAEWSGALLMFVQGDLSTAISAVVAGGAVILAWIIIQRIDRDRRKVAKMLGEKGKAALRRLTEALKPRPVSRPATQLS